MSAWRARAWVSLLALSGCPAPPEIHWEGEHVRLGSEEPSAVCEGTYAFLDARAGELAERVGAMGKVDYYWVPSGAEPYCPKIDGSLVGCFSGGAVFSEWIPHEHELVHAWTHELPRTLDEGLASYWGDPWPLYDMASRERFEAALRGEAEIEGAEEYARAAHFMTFLAETYGEPRLPELVRSIPRNAKTKAIDEVFVDVLGDSLEQTLAAYEEFPDCPGAVDLSLACAGEPVAVDLFSGGLSRELDCAAEDTVGPYQGMAFVEQLIEMPPSIAGSRLFNVSGDGIDKGGHALLRYCGPCSDKGVAELRGMSISDIDEFPPGRYVVRLYAPVDQLPATIKLSISG